MGLDAFVFCDCFEKGRLRKPPPNPKLVRVLPNGDLDCRSRNAKAIAEFDGWREDACRHEQGIIAGCELGNIWDVEDLRDELSGTPKLFPILLKKVLYCGSHCGDHLTVSDVEKLKIELGRLKSFEGRNADAAVAVAELRRDLEKLVKVALSIGKPIAF